MGGTIGLESEVGKGTTFEFLLPLRVAADHEKITTQTKITAAPEESLPPLPSDLRILVAEDDPVNQVITLLMLKRFGYEADVVTDGSQVLKALGDSLSSPQKKTLRAALS